MITPIGVLLVPLAAALFFASRRYLFLATVLSFPLFMVVCFQVGGTEVRAVYVLGAALMARQLLDAVVAQGEDSRRWRPSWIGSTTWLFLALLTLSLFMPALLEDRVYVVSTEVAFRDYAEVEILGFSGRNITQLVFPGFMVLLFFSVRAELRSAADVYDSLRWFVAGALITLASGLVMQVLFEAGTGLSTFMRVFRGNPETYTIANRMRPGVWPFPRMFSLAGEPGYTGLLFVGLAAFAAPIGWMERGRAAARARWLFVVATLGAILSASTTAFLAFAILLVGLVLLPLGRTMKLERTPQLRLPVFTVTSLAVVVVAALIVVRIVAPDAFSLLEYVDTSHVAKLRAEEGSGVTRMATVDYTLNEVLPRSPLLGVGVGSHRSGALAASILGMAGVIGLATFLLINVLAFVRGYRTYRTATDVRESAFGLAIAMALFAIVPTMLVGKSQVALTFAYYWYLLVLADRGLDLVRGVEVRP